MSTTTASSSSSTNSYLDDILLQDFMPASKEMIMEDKNFNNEVQSTDDKHQQQHLSSSSLSENTNNDDTMPPMKEHTFCKPMMMMSGNDHHSHQMLGSNMMAGMSQGMVMYMDGFRFATSSSDQPCLNLYFPNWTLDTPGKFCSGLILVFLLAFSTEGISKLRHNISTSRNQQQQQQIQRRQRQRRPVLEEQQSNSSTVSSSTVSSSPAMMESLQPDRLGQIMISSLHGIQALLGYIVMLATMTFSVEILISVILGLSTGYYYYFAGEVGLEGHVTTNPCCSYMQNESNEHEQHEQQLMLLQQQQQQLQFTTTSPSSHQQHHGTSTLQPTIPKDNDNTLTTSLLTVTSDRPEVDCCGNPVVNSDNDPNV